MIASVITWLLLIITVSLWSIITVIMGLFLPIITRSIIGNNGFIITYYWPGVTWATWGWSHAPLSPLRLLAGSPPRGCSRKTQSYSPSITALKDYINSGWTVEILPWVVAARGMVRVNLLTPALDFLEIPKQKWSGKIESVVRASVEELAYRHRIRFSISSQNINFDTDDSKSSCASHENRLSVGNKGKIPRYSADLRARQKDGGESMVIEDSCDVPPIMEITATPLPPYAKATWMFVILGKGQGNPCVDVCPNLCVTVCVCVCHRVCMSVLPRLWFWCAHEAGAVTPPYHDP